MMRCPLGYHHTHEAIMQQRDCKLLVRMEGNWNPCAHTSGNRTWFWHCGKSLVMVSKSDENLWHGPAIPKDWKQGLEQILACQMPHMLVHMSGFLRPLGLLLLSFSIHRTLRIKNTGVKGCHVFLQGIFPIQDQTCTSCLGWWILHHWAAWEAPARYLESVLLHEQKKVNRKVKAVWLKLRRNGKFVFNGLTEFMFWAD